MEPLSPELAAASLRVKEAVDRRDAAEIDLNHALAEKARVRIVELADAEAPIRLTGVCVSTSYEYNDEGGYDLCVHLSGEWSEDVECDDDLWDIGSDLSEGAAELLSGLVNRSAEDGATIPVGTLRGVRF